MEVHAHTHTPRQKWTHYFWEFLMLFLAVFCGFLAEYQLEHKIEKDREKQYIRSLLEDLAEDTVSLQGATNDFQMNAMRSDTLMKLLTNPSVKERGAELYYLGRRASRSDAVALHDKTIQQMKNSGGFRLIGNQKVASAIIEYYNLYISVDHLLKVDMDIRQEYRLAAIHVFHPLLFDSIVMANNTVMRPQGNFQLRSYETEKLLNLAGIVGYLKSTRIGIAGVLVNMSGKARELIILIKKEYHFK
jgi:hypothetical protein